MLLIVQRVFINAPFCRSPFLAAGVCLDVTRLLNPSLSLSLSTRAHAIRTHMHIQTHTHSHAIELPSSLGRFLSQRLPIFLSAT